MTDRRAYAAAGVDVDAGDRAVSLMRDAVEATHGPNVIGGLGGFGAAVAVPAGFREPVLVSSTDGVGTKTVIAAQLGRFETIGRDLVAMCVDDVVCAGAAPLFFLDYVAVGRIDPLGIADLVGGIAGACADAGCALVGGETAEHPGVMDAQAFDLAGCCVGIVERGRLLDGSGAEAGDAIVGIASSGLHANGYSLVRTLIESWELDLSTPYQEQLMRSLGREADETIHAEPRHVLATLGEVLLEPTLLYAPAILALREALEAAGSELRGVAHITGGGLPGNLPRMLPASLGARVDPASWPVPSVIRLFAALGGLDGLEARATFNGGVGMAVAVSPAAVDVTIQSLAERGHEAWQIGEVVPVDGLEGARYSESGSGAEA